MKIIFEITGEIDETDDVIGSLEGLTEAVETLRGFGSAEVKYKISSGKDEWIRI